LIQLAVLISILAFPQWYGMSAEQPSLW